MTVMLDIKKTFDTNDHGILLTKLDYYGIKHDELNFFKSYLNKRQATELQGQQLYFWVKRNKIRCSTRVCTRTIAFHCIYE